MNRYESLELEIKNISVDIITASPVDVGGDTPAVGMPDDFFGED
jgi:hypothetical protein